MYKKLLSIMVCYFALSNTNTYGQSTSYGYVQAIGQVAMAHQSKAFFLCANLAIGEKKEKSALILMMKFDLSKAVMFWLNDISKKIKTDLESQGMVYDNISVSEKKLTVTFTDIQTLHKAQQYLAKQALSLSLITPENELDGYQMAIDNKAISAFKEKTIQRAIENVTYRLQQINIVDAQFLPYTNEMLISLIPGVTKETQQNVINQLSAVNTLQFRLVYDGDDVFDIIDDKKPVPMNMEILMTPDNRPLLVYRKDLEILSDHLMDASTAEDQYGGRNQIIISFDKEGAEHFYKLTRENIGKRLAIILIDGAIPKPQVLSTPVIMEPIANGRVMISGLLNQKEAKDIANSIFSHIVVTNVVIQMQCTIDSIQN